MTRIDTVDQLNALPIGSIVIDSDCDVMHKAWDPKTGGDHWSHMGSERPGSLWLPVQLVYVPGRDLVQEAQANAWDEGLAAGWADNDREWVESGTKPADDFEHTPNPYRQKTS